ncbi:hypothetical protein EYS14_07285 [Alteromonadaceae bacterium M269]|nr:hypothetical protein EYS14_07285 [Alteromonadaceae bacterium M269]
MKIVNSRYLKALSASALLGFSSLSYAATFVIEKQNTNFSIDGNGGARVGQVIYLWQTNTGNTNQNWDQLTRAGGFFAYRKQNTNLCWDGGDGGARRQPVTLQVCDVNDQNQHWRKVKVFSGTEIYRLEKRNAPGFSIDGNGGADFRQELYLWNSSNTNVNQQWDFIRTDTNNSGGGSDGGNTGGTQFVLASDVNVDRDGNIDFNGSGVSDDRPICTNTPPSDRFDMTVWALDTPREDPDRSGRGHRLDEDELVNFIDNEYFCIGRDNGLVFRSTVDGFKTSSGTSFTRSELREMLRRGDTSIRTRDAGNNWVFSSQPSSSFTNAAGGVDGTLRVTMTVNRVTTTGDGLHPGRVIIGQIHASDDEPARLYYHKLPGNTNGSIYLASEERNGSDDLINIIGSESRSQSNPARGIPLNEPFSYEIRTVGDKLFVTITKADGTEYSLGDDIDSARSSERNVSSDGSIRMLGYNTSDEYMYFKVGTYTQNNTGNGNDYDQVTVYSIDNRHN